MPPPAPTVVSANRAAHTSSYNNASLPGNRVYASAYVANGYVYVVGGSTTDPSMNPTNTTYYGKINSAGYVSSWSTSAQTLPQTKCGRAG